ncbi:MAG TPA: DUF4445 domain-containing protein [Thermopetrobacter sp.]|nr:DUF4445 domain-containing protein [Thermopetrobacter sp.]
MTGKTAKYPCRVLFMPSGLRGTSGPEETLLGAARRLGVDLDSACGGRAICGRCQIAVQEGRAEKEGITSAAGHLSPPTEAEKKYADLRGLRQGRRLACQARVMGDVIIDVPPESQLHEQLVRKEADSRDIAVDPLIRALPLRLDDPAELAAALAEEWAITEVEIDESVTPPAGEVTAILHQPHIDATPRVIDVRPGFDEKLLGLAVDVGSTTIAAHLVDLHTGDVLAAAGRMNPQIRFGEDLMSRVSYAMMHENGAQEMTRAVREAINELAAEVSRDHGGPGRILDVVLVGNPVMHHLLLGYDPIPLGQAPFTLHTDQAVEQPARNIDLDLAPGARSYVLPVIAGHVGADAAAVVLAEAPHERDAVSLIVDVGTNAEIVLGNRARLLACSSPTGPALEGAQISSGQRAAPGAIERVRIDRATLKPRFKVIGVDVWSDAEGFAEQVKKTGITGICGSGIIEVVAEMYLAGVIDEDGRFNTALADTSPYVEARGRSFAYILRPQTDGQKEVSITQEDVRAVQLAKAALYAGARLLMDEMGIDAPDRIRLAGAFGNHIDPLYAMVLGLIPDCDLNRVSSAGNAAGTGARMALVSMEARREIERLAREIVKIETATEPRFQEHFVAAMALPHKSAPMPHLAAAIDLPPRKPQARRTRRTRRR